MSDKRTVKETIKYFEQLASEFESKAVREQDELAKIQYAAKAEAYELAAFELQHNMQTELSDKEKRAIHDQIECENMIHDIGNRIDCMDVELTDQEIAEAASWLNNVYFDSNATYWDNIDAAIAYALGQRPEKSA